MKYEDYVLITDVVMPSLLKFMSAFQGLGTKLL